jgi:hypothetical protein
MSDESISADWMGKVIRGPSVMVESTVGGGSLMLGGTINKSKLLRIVSSAVDAAKKGNVIQLSFTIQPVKSTLI